MKSYYAIIPANVRYDKRIAPNAKLLYGEITALCNERGYCWATNGYFAELYDKSEETISRWISSLAKANHIIVKIDKKKANQRIISITGAIDEKVKPIDENVNSYEQKDQEVLMKKSRGLDENVKHNITLNNKSNNTNRKYALMSEANASNVSSKNFEYFEIASAFYKLFESNSESIGVEWLHLKKIGANDFIDPIRLMITADKRSIQDLRKVFDFLRENDFWKSNCQTSKSLREKFDKLITQSKTNNNNGRTVTESGWANIDPDYKNY